MNHRAVVIVTGSTSGVGFGICHRLLDQLCFSSPSDAYQSSLSSDTYVQSSLSDTDVRFIPCSSLTLILPCRSIARGEKARIRLLSTLENKVQSLRRLPSYDGHAERFWESLAIDVMYCDLAIVKSILEFSEQVKQKYPYITHIINNAGTGSFLGVHIMKGLRELVTNPVRAVTAPTYKIEVKGELSVDGLGWVWQCNVFGHFILYKELFVHLLKSPFPTSRVIWMSSLEALRETFDSSDWQLVKTEMPYEGSKCQMDLVAVTLDKQCHAQHFNQKGPMIRHLVVQPGVVHTDILGANQIGWVLDLLKLFAFYLARLLSSQNHTIQPYTSAISAVHTLITPKIDSTDPSGPYCSTSEDDIPFKFGSKTDWRGRPYVGLDTIDVWSGNQQAGADLVLQMDRLYTQFSAMKEG